MLHQNHIYPTQGLPREAFALSHSGLQNGQHGRPQIPQSAKEERCMTDFVSQALLMGSDERDQLLRKNSLNSRTRPEYRDEDKALKFSQATFGPEPGLLQGFDDQINGTTALVLEALRDPDQRSTGTNSNNALKPKEESHNGNGQAGADASFLEMLVGDLGNKQGVESSKDSQLGKREFSQSQLFETSHSKRQKTSSQSSQERPQQENKIVLDLFMEDYGQKNPSPSGEGEESNEESEQLEDPVVGEAVDDMLLIKELLGEEPPASSPPRDQSPEEEVHKVAEPFQAPEPKESSEVTPKIKAPASLFDSLSKKPAQSNYINGIKSFKKQEAPAEKRPPSQWNMSPKKVEQVVAKPSPPPQPILSQRSNQEASQNSKPSQSQEFHVAAEETQLYKKVFDTVVSNAGAYNQNFSRLRYYNRMQFHQQERKKASEERVPLRSQNNSQFLNCVYPTQHSIQGLNFYNQLNQVSVEMEMFRKKSSITYDSFHGQKLNGYLYGKAEVRRREEKAFEVIRQRQMLKRGQEKLFEYHFSLLDKKKADHYNLVSTLNSQRGQTAEQQQQATSFLEQSQQTFETKKSDVETQMRKVREQMAEEEAALALRLKELERS